MQTPGEQYRRDAAYRDEIETLRVPLRECARRAKEYQTEEEEHKMSDPINNPQPGDRVIATVDGVSVMRMVVSVLPFSTVYIQFRVSKNGLLDDESIESWQSWCKKNNAEVVG